MKKTKLIFAILACYGLCMAPVHAKDGVQAKESTLVEATAQNGNGAAGDASAQGASEGGTSQVAKTTKEIHFVSVKNDETEATKKLGNYQNDGATGEQSIAIGQNAVAGGENSIAIGVGAVTTGSNSIAIGQQAKAQKDSVLIGEVFKKLGDGEDKGKPVGVDPETVYMGAQNSFSSFAVTSKKEDKQFALGGKSVFIGSGNTLRNDVVGRGTHGTLMVGNGNELVGNYITVFGRDNLVQSHPNNNNEGQFVFGGKNKVVKDYGTVTGQRNYINFIEDDQLYWSDVPNYPYNKHFPLYMGGSNIYGNDNAVNGKKRGDGFEGIQLVEVFGRANLLPGGTSEVSVFGATNKVYGFQSIVMGQGNTLGAFGTNNKLRPKNTILLGVGNESKYDRAIVVGYSSNVQGDSSIAIGRRTSALGENSLAIGDLVNYGVEANAKNAIAVGVRANTLNDYATAVGYGVEAHGSSSTALGMQSESLGKRSTSVGAFNEAHSDLSNAVGYWNRTLGDESGAFGSANQNMGEKAYVFGARNSSQGDLNLVMGADNTVISTNSILIGAGSKITSEIIPETQQVKAFTEKAVVLGSGATSGISDSVVLGSSSVASRDKGSWGLSLNKSYPVDKEGAKSVAAEFYSSKSAFSAGQLKVDEAETAFEAANQDYEKDKSAENEKKKNAAENLLKASQQELTQLEAAYNANLTKFLDSKIPVWQGQLAAVSIGDPETGLTRQITGVAAGTNDTDAVNVAQLNAAIASVKVTAGTNIKVEQPNSTSSSSNPSTGATEPGATPPATGDGVKVSLADVVTFKNDENKEAVKISKDGIELSNQTNIKMGKGKITGLGRGEADDDAVNVGQLREAVSKAGGNLTIKGDQGVYQATGELGIKGGADVQHLTENNIGVVVDGEGKTAKVKLSENLDGMNSITFGDANAANRVSISAEKGLDNGGHKIMNVAAGTAPTDAVNVGQLDSRIASSEHRMRKYANAGTASAMAAANIPQAYVPGHSALGVGLGYSHGQSALAVGVSTINDKGDWIFKGSASVNSEGGVFGAGASYMW